MKEMDNKNNTPQMRVIIIKQLYGMFLSPEGRTFIAREERFRNVLIKKMVEYASNPNTQNDIQFVALSENLKTAIENIQNVL
jgi:hypothetical protein